VFVAFMFGQNVWFTLGDDSTACAEIVLEMCFVIAWCEFGGVLAVWLCCWWLL